jgi:hypothetical protein
MVVLGKNVAKDKLHSLLSTDLQEKLQETPAEPLPLIFITDDDGKFGVIRPADSDQSGNTDNRVFGRMVIGAPFFNSRR